MVAIKEVSLICTPQTRKDGGSTPAPAPALTTPCICTPESRKDGGDTPAPAPALTTPRICTS